MKFLEERIKTILEELKRDLYPDLAGESFDGALPGTFPITRYQYKCTEEKGFEACDPDALDWEVFDAADEWGGDRQYYWFVTEVSVPDFLDGKCVTYFLFTGREGGWDAVNPQFEAYVNGKLVQGLDVNHRSFVLSEEARAGERFRIALRAYTGDRNDRLMLKSGLCALDRNLERLYYDLLVPYSVAALLPKTDETRLDILGVLEETVNLLDLRVPLSAEFHDSAARAEEYLTREFYEKRCGKSPQEVWCVGHTHIDVAWLWTVSVTKEKALRSFSTVLNLMKEYPEYRFLSSQPQLYKFVKEQSPELFEEIRTRVREGRWEPEGSLFLESDCNLVSGESLVRQILFGKRFFREEFGVENRIAWLPDTFGFSGALPQILKKSGIPYFMTTKLSWNDTDPFPYDVFRWKGIDGSEVLTSMIPASDYKAEGFFTTYNGTVNASQVMGAWKHYRQKDLNDKVLMSFGFGDGGGGPTKEMLEEQRRFAKGIPGCPKTVMTTAGEYFRSLDREVSGNRFLPTWSGELYLEFHRGTYTSMARNKKYNRKSEFMVQNAELYSILGERLVGAPYPKQEIDGFWEVILRNQFHDILPGSAIREAYADSKTEYETILSEGARLQSGLLGRLASSVASDCPGVVVFNSQSFPCTDAVVFELPTDIDQPVIFDGGRPLACQKTADGKAVFLAPDVPSKGYKTFELKNGEYRADTGTVISPAGFSNRFFSAEFDDKLQLVSLYDKRASRQVIAKGQTANVLTAYEDRPFGFDAWNVESYYREKSWPVDDVQSAEVTENGPVRSCIRITRKFLSSTVVQSIYIYDSLARIDVKNEVDWKERQILLRASFPVDVHAEEGTYDIQFGNIRRPAHQNTSWDAAQFEVCAHKWADLSEDGYGVALMNDCKYGCDIHDGVIGLSLLKSATYPNPEADRERHEFLYSLFPHQGGWREAGVVQAAYALNNSMKAVAIPATPQGALPKAISLINSSAENVIVETVKKAENGEGTVVRLYECYNRRSAVTVSCAGEIGRVRECDLMENPLADVEVQGHEFTFEIRPYEIKTFLIS